MTTPNVIDAANNYLDEAVETFTIPSKIRDRYKIDGDLNNVSNWSAQIYSNNSGGDSVNIGDWDGVGYILVNLKTNEIIPVALSDEHKVGWYFFDDLRSDKLIRTNSDNWISVAVGHPNDYLYGEVDDKKKIEAYKKLISYGLNPKKHNIIQIYDSNRKPVNKKYRLDKFLLGQEEERQNKLVSEEMSEFAKKLTQYINTFAHMYKTYLEATSPTIKGQLEKQISSILWDLMSLIGMNREIIEPADLRSTLEFIKRVGTIDNEDDVQEVARLILGTGGIKNRIHTKLVRSKSEIGKELLGNLELADAEFKRIDSI